MNLLGASPTLVLPEDLKSLIADGIWPARARATGNSLGSRIDVDILSALAPGEVEISFYPPPFWTVARSIERDSYYWKMPEVMIWQIDPEKTIVIGDFGPGSDSPLALDYRSSPENPSVIRLQWANIAPKRNNQWALVAPTFREFWKALGLDVHPSQREGRSGYTGKMPLSRKQQIYMDIMFWILPQARNVQTWPAWRRLLHGNIYVDLEFVHNIPPLMAHADMTEQDVYWLNTQACNYATACEASPRDECRTILSYIRDLVDMVPPELRGHLRWDGPAASSKLAPLLSVPTAVGWSSPLP